MSRLEELIKEYCPDGVEFRKIKDVYRRLKGTPITAGKMKEIENPDGDIRIFAGGKTVINAFEEDIPNANITRVPAVLVQSRGVIDAIYYDKPFTFKNEMWAYTTDEQVSVKYLYYVLKNNVEYFRTAASGMGSLPQISLPVTEEFKIPVPPIEVQREIIRILDDFTELTAELTAKITAEITDRKVQYEFYRDTLLSFNNDVERIPLGDLFEFRNGLSKGKDFFGRGVPFIRYTDVYNNRILHKENITALVECSPKEIESLRVSRGDVLFTRTSETTEDVGWSSVMLDDVKDCVFNGFTIKASPKTDKLLPEFCAYCFCTDSFRRYVGSHCAFTTRASLTASTIADYKLAVPTLAVQKRIADTLDNFEAICNDLNIGLPAETEARKKQYEYYRDMLLTFAETGAIISSETGDRRPETGDRRPETGYNILKLLQYVFGYAPVALGEVILSLNTGLNPRQFFKLNTDDAVNYYITIREIQNGHIVPSDKTDRMNDEALRLCNNRSNLEVGDVLFSGTGTIGETAVISTEPKNWNIKEGVYTIKPNPQYLNSSFLRYLLITKPIKDAYMKKVAGGTVKSIPMKEMRLLQIPLPTLAKQEELVKMLKRFDAICNDLSSGLPAEIEARQKQYEYYRDKLLSFNGVE